MNLKKTNPLSIGLIEARFGNIDKNVNNILVESNLLINSELASEFMANNKSEANLVNMSVLKWKATTKVLRLSKQVIQNCQLINIEAIKGNLDISDFNFDSLVILLDNDDAGLIKIERLGSDFTFLFLQNLKKGMETHFNSYSFLAKEFLFSEVNSIDRSLFVVQVLAYLYYGDITERFIPAKSEIKLSAFSKLLNNSKVPITYVDSLWRQRISTEGFKVKGHFRLQPIGEKRAKRKLIWIEEYNKDSYNRKATSEICQ